MRRLRSRLGTLVILIVLSAVGLAALRESSEIWDSGVFSLTLGMLLISTLFAIHRTDERRSFWIGFAVFGTAYLGLSLVPSIESRLITTKALTYLDSIVPGRYLRVWTLGVSVAGSVSSNYQIQNVAVIEDGTQASTSIPGQWRIWNVATSRGGTRENFVRNGHSLLALLVGWFGGLLSRRLCRTSRPPNRSTTVETEGIIP